MACKTQAGGLASAQGIILAKIELHLRHEMKSDARVVWRTKLIQVLYICLEESLLIYLFSFHRTKMKQKQGPCFFHFFVLFVLLFV